MTVVISSKDILAGTVTPTALSQPALVIDIPDQPDEYIVEGYIDLSQMLTGDEVIIEEYMAVDGANRKLLTKSKFANTQDEPIIRFHSKTIKRDAKYRVQLTQTKGTLRKYPYYFIKLNFGVV
ncbi:hypothetical protein DRO24_05190 [Candidatus Bathyarchaeota archaeon]|nr:MAG: hypothetical protein DRO24_05190 [Candidatus Bathyarchaeota archaeon]